MTAPPAEHALIDALNRDAYAQRFRDPQGACELAAGAAARAEAVDYALGRGYALCAMGAARCLMSELVSAAADLQAAERIFVAEADPIGLAMTQTWLGSVARRQSGPAEAMRRCLAALETFRKHDHHAGEASALLEIGNIHIVLKEFAHALPAYGGAERIAREIGDEGLIPIIRGNIASVHAELGDDQRSVELFEEALTLARLDGNRVQEAITLTNLAIAKLRTAREAFDLGEFMDVAERLRNVGMRREEAAVYTHLGHAHLSRGDPQGALRYYSGAVARARRLTDRAGEIRGLVGSAAALHRLGDTERAERQLTRALEQAQDYGSPAHQAMVHEALAELYESTGDAVAALRHLRTLHVLSSAIEHSQAEAVLQTREAVEEAARTRREAELQAIRSELQVLKAQMQPHFLLNALSAAATLVHEDPAAADEMLVRLGNLLRLSVRQSADQEITLAQELEFLSGYLEVEQMRLQKPLAATFDVEPSLLTALVPNLVLQPLAENSIRHGLLDQVDDPQLLVSGRLGEDGTLTLSVRDNGMGLSPDGSSHGMGIGLTNLKERLSRLYGGRGSLEIAALDRGTLAVLRLPLHR